MKLKNSGKKTMDNFNCFANILDSCIKNKKKLLWFSYFGPHNYRIMSIGKFMPCSEHFEVKVKCSLCGCESQRSFVKYNELLWSGFEPEFINKIDSDNFAYEDEINEYLENKLREKDNEV